METQQRTIACLVCGSNLATPADVVANELIDCEACGSEFEVTGLNPLAIIEAPLEEEDWGE